MDRPVSVPQRSISPFRGEVSEKYLLYDFGRPAYVLDQRPAIDARADLSKHHPRVLEDASEAVRREIPELKRVVRFEVRSRAYEKAGRLKNPPHFSQQRFGCLTCSSTCLL